MDGALQRKVGENLRAYREARGLSQEAFADVLDCHRTYMGSVERGERNLTLQTLERIAAQIDVDPISLLVEPKKGKGAARTRKAQSRSKGGKSSKKAPKRTGGKAGKKTKRRRRRGDH